MTIKTGISIIFASALLAGGALASPNEYSDDERYAQRGPVPFELLDRNGDGVVTAAEHAQTRSERQAWRAHRNYPMRGAANAPQFEQIDRDASGALDREELDDWQEQRKYQRYGNRMGPLVR